MDGINEVANMKAMKEILNQKKLIVAPGCYDALTARCSELVGFDAAYLSGYCFEASHNGTPDLGFTTSTELAEACNRITSAIGIPLIVDCDTGFGGKLSIHRTVRLMERAGVSAIHIEDQVNPKKCVAIQGSNTTVNRQEAVDRIKAALDARTNPDMLIIGRTESSKLGFDEMVERCNLFLEAGADLAMPIWYGLEDQDGVPAMQWQGNRQLELIKCFCQSINGPVVNQGSRPPDGFYDSDLEEVGIRIQIYAGDLIGAVTASVFEILNVIKQTGNATDYIRSHPAKFYNAEVQELMHLEEYLRIVGI